MAKLSIFQFQDGYAIIIVFQYCAVYHLVIGKSLRPCGMCVMPPFILIDNEISIRCDSNTHLIAIFQLFNARD